MTTARSHSRFLSAKEICERALRKINAYSINDSAADPEHLAEALIWLDIIVAALVETNKCFWLMPATLEIPLTADTTSYNLTTTLGDAYPSGGILYPISAAIRDSSGLDEPLTLLKRQEWLDVIDKDASGTTTQIYVDRVTNDLTVYVNPVVSESSAFTLLLDVQTYAADMTHSNGAGDTDMGPGWNLYLITELAGQIGDGPVRRVNAATVRTWKEEAVGMKSALLNYSNQNRPGQSGLRRTAAWGARR